jgi:hypothetical protein
VGALTTVPLAIEVLGASRSVDYADWTKSGRDVSPAHFG